MHDGDGGVRVFTLQRQEIRQRAPDREAPTDDHHVFALDLDAVTHEELDDAGRGAGDGPEVAHHQAAQVDRMEAVDVLLGVDGQQGLELVELLGQR